MPSKGPRLVCPECQKKGVTLRLRVDEDLYACQYCDWFAYTGSQDTQDVHERARLLEANPHHPLRPQVEGDHDD